VHVTEPEVCICHGYPGRYEQIVAEATTSEVQHGQVVPIALT